nr:MAG: hypothetical protein DIU68_02810 [Chloroflexota bacterium]
MRERFGATALLDRLSLGLGAGANRFRFGLRADGYTAALSFSLNFNRLTLGAGRNEHFSFLLLLDGKRALLLHFLLGGSSR